MKFYYTLRSTLLGNQGDDRFAGSGERSGSTVNYTIDFGLFRIRSYEMKINSDREGHLCFIESKIQIDRSDYIILFTLSTVIAGSDSH